MRRAPRAASRAAPVRAAPPESTSVCPRSYLWAAKLRLRKGTLPEVGPVGEGLAAEGRRAIVSAQMPISASVERAATGAPGQEEMARLAGREGHGPLGTHGDAPRPRPYRRRFPRGGRRRKHGATRCVDPFDDGSRLAVDIPREPRSEERVDDEIRRGRIRPPRRVDRRRSKSTPRRAASPVRPAPGAPRSATATYTPRSARRRAATKPSPPLLPGPQTTRTLPLPATSGQRHRRPLALPSPSARSPGCRPRMVRASASFIARKSVRRIFRHSRSLPKKCTSAPAARLPVRASANILAATLLKSSVRMGDCA